MNTVLQAENLGRRYERSGRPFWAVRGVSLSLSEGRMMLIRGRSGCGKSTLISMLAGLLRPSEGRALLCGTDLSAAGDAEAARLRSDVLGYVPQNASLIASLTVLDNVRLPWYLQSRGPEPEGRAQELLAQLGLAELAQQYPNALSGGEARRVSLARALMNGPKVIVADEPTSNLDGRSAEMVSALLRNLADGGCAVLAVSHDGSGLSKADAVLELDKNEKEAV